MPNKRKTISNAIDLILIIVINTLVVGAFLKLLSLFILKMDVIFYIVVAVDTTLVTLNIPNILKLPKTIGKKIGSILVKDENKKITWKEIIIFIIIWAILDLI